MFSYTFHKAYTLNKLTEEIAAAGIPMMSLDLTSSTEFTVNVAQQLTNAQQAALNQVVGAHAAISTLQESVAAKIMAARDFGVRLIAQYGAQNVLSGYTVEQIQEIMIRTAKVQSALNTGSLYVAISELNSIELDDSIITAPKIKVFRNQIEDYLQIPRT